jgi:hypothetical protein
MGYCRQDTSGSGQRPMASSRERSSDPSGTVKCWDNTEQLLYAILKWKRCHNHPNRKFAIKI